MGAKLCSRHLPSKRLFDEASFIAGLDLLKVCTEGPMETLSRTEVAQAALFVSSMAALEKLKYEDPDCVRKCDGTMGLSLGEYSALCFAGALSFSEGVRTTCYVLLSNTLRC